MLIIRGLLPALAAAAALAAAPQAAALPAAGTTPAGEVVIYDTAAPGTILDRHQITGLQPGETIEALDVRPATGQLYALGILNNDGRMYVLDPGTGVATLLGPGPFTTLLDTASFGMDFNPVADRIRIVSSVDQNLRVNPNNAALVQFDTPLDDAGGAEQVPAVAYDQNTAGTTQTTAWGYEFLGNTVVRIGGYHGDASSGGSANAGVLTRLGPSGFTAAVTAPLGMDIAPSGEAFMTITEAGPTVHRLVRAHLGSGAATEIGTFPEQVEGVAVLHPSSIALDGAAAVVAEDGGTATITVRRSGNTVGTQAVQYATSDGTATGADYTVSGGTITFAPGETSKTFTIPISADGEDEPWETVNVALSAPTGGATLGTPASGTLTIVDDDAPAPAADTTAPQLLVSAPATRRRGQVNKGVRGKVASSEAATIQLVLKLGKRTIGRRTVTPTGAGVSAFRLKPGKKGRAALRSRLRRARRATLRVRATGTDAAGNRATASALLAVRR